MLALVTPAIVDPFTYVLLLMPVKHGHIPIGYIQGYYALLHCLAGLIAYFLINDLKLKSAFATIAASVVTLSAESSAIQAGFSLLRKRYTARWYSCFCLGGKPGAGSLRQHPQIQFF